MDFWWLDAIKYSQKLNAEGDPLYLTKQQLQLVVSERTMFSKTLALERSSACDVKI